MSIVPDVALPAARRSSDDSIPWSIELRSRCMNTFFSVAAISLHAVAVAVDMHDRRRLAEPAASDGSDSITPPSASPMPCVPSWHSMRRTASRAACQSDAFAGSAPSSTRRLSLMCARSTIRKSAPCTASPLRPSVTALIVA